MTHSNLYKGKHTDESGFYSFLTRACEHNLSFDEQNSCEGLMKEFECANICS